jgi:hypothetical protein
MSFKAELKFNDSKNVYTVIDCDYEFTQDTDSSGKPCGITKFGRISVTVETISDPVLIKWTLGSANIRSGSITFFKDDSGKAKLKSLNFKQAVCVYLHERFTSYGENPMITELAFVAQEVSIDGEDYESQWTNF